MSKNQTTTTNFDCVLTAWHQYETEIRHFLLKQTKTADQTDDVLQEVFLKAMRAGQDFCVLENPRAWLFRVCRNVLIDKARLSKNFIEEDANLKQPQKSERLPLDELDSCIAKNLPALCETDRDIIEKCDLNGMRQQDYADYTGLSLPATKARLKRARQRLRNILSKNCQVQYDESGSICCHIPLK